MALLSGEVALLKVDNTLIISDSRQKQKLRKLERILRGSTIKALNRRGSGAFIILISLKNSTSHHNERSHFHPRRSGRYPGR